MSLLEKQILFSGRATTGWSTPIYVRDFRHIIIGLSTDGLDAAETIRIKIAHSFEETVPTFSTAASITNKWAYVQSLDLADGAIVDGATGVAITGSNGVKYLEINQNAASWISVQVSTIDAGTVDVEAWLSTNT
jgi:hypothetical protein